ncbi:MAG: hypothetical protein AB7U73_00815 [Pirellulales bacterium]
MQVAIEPVSLQLQAQIAALAERQAELELQLRELAERELRVAAAEDALAESRYRFEAEQASAARRSADGPDACDAPTSIARPEDAGEVDLEATQVLRRLQAAGIWRDSDRNETTGETTADKTREAATSAEVKGPPGFTATRALETERFESAETTGAESDRPQAGYDENPVVSTAPSPAAPRAGEDEDDLQESIERYMERLLGRSRTVPNQATATAKVMPPVEARTHEPSVPRWTPPDANSTQPTDDATDDPPRKALKPARTAAPERQCDLQAMRELANASARAHLAQHTRDERRAMLQTKLSVLIVSLVSAIFLLTISPRGSTPWCGGIVSLLVAGFWGIQIAVITGKLTIDAQGGLLITQARETSSRLAQRLRGVR